MSDNTDTWEARISYCVELIREWEDATSTGDGAPAVGSRVAREDGLNPASPFSLVAWSSIAMAVDHLGLADDALSREGGPRLRPFAFYTLTRGALVAASQAIWVLTGSRDTRLRRLRLIELEELKGSLSFLEDYANDPSLPEIASSEFMAELKAKKTEVASRRRELRSALRPQQGEGSVTQMLKDAAREINQRRDDDPWLIRAYLAEWRLASGGAHARLWPGDIRPHEKIPLIGQGQSIRISTGTTESYGSSLAAAVMATSEAFHLWAAHAE